MTTALLFSTLVYGCASSSDLTYSPDYRHPSLTEGQARLVFFRTRQSKLYRFRAASLSVNGETVARMPFGGFTVVDVPAGSQDVRASMWDMPGECVIRLDASSLQTQYFQVIPRDESASAYASANIAGDIAATILTGNAILGSLAGVAGGLIASSAESSEKVCGGAFVLAPVVEADAQVKMNGLKFSE